MRPNGFSLPRITKKRNKNIEHQIIYRRREFVKKVCNFGKVSNYYSKIIYYWTFLFNSAKQL